MEDIQKCWKLSQDEVLEKLETSENGLTTEEAKKRLEKYGKNALDEVKRLSLLKRFLNQLKDVMIIVLLVAALISGILAIIQKQYLDLVDTFLILIIVIVNAIIGLIQEDNAEKALAALKDMNKPFAKVLRDGAVFKILSEELVVGDVVVLEAGDVAPADMRLFESASLKMEEASLTGESVPTEKHCEIIEKEEVPIGDRANMCYSTGVVTYGRGKAVVVKTGMNTEVGKIAKMLAEDKAQTTPLQKQLDKSAKVISVGILIIAVVIFIAGILFRNKDEDIASAIIFSFMSAIAIAVAAIPEGLPAVVTIVMSIGVKAMSKRKAIVSSLPAVETLGSCQVICSDKTGTLTLNQMTVKQLYNPVDGMYQASDTKYGAVGKTLIRTMVLCNDTQVTETDLVGDPTETALVAYANDQKFNDISSKFERLEENPFDSKRKLMSTINNVDGEKIAHIKGATDILISRCKYILDKKGVREITDEDIKLIEQKNHEMGQQALRVLGFAIKTTKEDENLDLDKVEEDVIFVGLVGMIDPPRAEVKDAVATCRKAGILPVMITGDHMDTAKAIAKEIGILTEDGLAITGAELDQLSDEEFLDKVEHINVYARVSPENKVRIVKTFQAKNKIVAMTGDGVNDAPSIKAADIGIGMGITGTDVSKGASDMVLADDNFATIVAAVEEGRKVYSNIKKSIHYLLSANIAEVLCMFIVTVILSAIMKESIVFLTPVMILWVNLVTDSLPALALGTEKAEADVMDMPPRKNTNNLFSGMYGLNIIVHGIFQTILVLAAYFIGEYTEIGHNEHGEAMTMAFLTLCVIQLFHAYNLRSDHNSLFAANPFSNKYLNGSFIIGMLLIIFSIAIPSVGALLFDTIPLHISQWAICLALGFAIIPIVEIHKIFIRLHMKKSIEKEKLSLEEK